MRAGEIVGIAGVEGNGQSELIEAITGLRHPESGEVAVAGQVVQRPSARRMLDVGVGHIPEDRQRRGLVLEFSIAENIALHDYYSPPASRFGWLFPRRLIERARTLIREFDIRGGGPQTLGGALSGGNQQKVVAAREIARDPKVLVAAQPTRGLDVGAIEYLHRRLVEERDEGRAILLDLARARRGALALRPHPGHVRGRGRRRAPARRDRGGDRARDARRPPQGDERA